ncbi:MAG: RNA 2',3'-cyclic phosphodiesterase [Anaerolineae bacterium]|nr:RNA 2',3'-cyclic phosphodiesterase [Thermoflexus sp.]MDW8065192.1 RNA 2',3'-cyclic phosphodiesterase [Anaerolineae bacterium]
MVAVRAFIAVEIPPELQKQLAQVQDRLRRELRDLPIRWVQPESIHLTLKFLGMIPASHIDEIVAALRGLALERGPFTFVVEGIGCFPDLQHPRVIWAGISDPTRALGVFQRLVESSMQKLGYPPEDRPYQPHLTLGRVGREAAPAHHRRIAEVIEQTTAERFGEVRAAEIVLMRSDLHPHGAVYTPIARVPLRGSP